MGDSGYTTIRWYPDEENSWRFAIPSPYDRHKSPTYGAYNEYITALRSPEKENLMYVFHVFAIDKRSDEIVYSAELVGRNRDAIKMIALADIVRENEVTNEDIDNYHFIVQQIGEGYSK